eukprot:TRINITY_DN3150_c0_g1_i2.p1 TRINITY_DN3150_c0_g1~~TRINITY_DN3150_c0_g1_i2.p1  ORF type:complete len:266 (-),score=67.57 TRINITY_DN3150_c0_g1_i2:441-1238(-)
MMVYNAADGEKQEPLSVSKSSVMPVAAEYRFQPSQMEFNHTLGCATYPYADPYFSGVLAAYPAPAMVHPNMHGMQHGRMLLRLDMTEEPVYVNAKQYHGILRRRQLRAKAESENKLIKTRKPYLHESRHLHAMKRARGNGGRFLNTKKAAETKPSTDNGKTSEGNLSQSGSSSISDVLHSDASLQNTHATSEKSVSQVLGMSESELSKGDSNYSFCQSDAFSNHYPHSNYHLSAFHPLPSRNDEGSSGQNGMFSGGSQQRIVVIQ